MSQACGSMPLSLAVSIRVKDMVVVYVRQSTQPVSVGGNHPGALVVLNRPSFGCPRPTSYLLKKNYKVVQTGCRSITQLNIAVGSGVQTDRLSKISSVYDNLALIKSAEVWRKLAEVFS